MNMLFIEPIVWLRQNDEYSFKMLMKC